MNNRLPFICFLNAIALALSSLGASDFSQNFDKISSVEELVGAGDGQFDFVGKAGNAAALSIEDGAFQVVVEYDRGISGMQNSGVRLTRISPLISGANFMVVSCVFFAKPNSPFGAKTPVLNITVGQNFRTTPYNPARDGRSDEGPAFAALTLQAAKTQGLFQLSAGPRDLSMEFPGDPDTDGYLQFQLTLAFNAGKEAVSFESPSGKVEIPPGTFSVWNGTEKVWGDRTANNPEALLENFSFGLGKGTDATGDQGAEHDGIYRLKNIRVVAEQK